MNSVPCKIFEWLCFVLVKKLKHTVKLCPLTAWVLYIYAHTVSDTLAAKGWVAEHHFCVWYAGIIIIEMCLPSKHENIVLMSVTVCDAGPELKHYWINFLCLLSNSMLDTVSNMWKDQFLCLTVAFRNYTPLPPHGYFYLISDQFSDKINNVGGLLSSVLYFLFLRNMKFTLVFTTFLMGWIYNFLFQQVHRYSVSSSLVQLCICWPNFVLNKLIRYLYVLVTHSTCNWMTSSHSWLKIVKKIRTLIL